MSGYSSSGTDTVVKIVLIFFISLLSFSIGTFVGKKFSDNQHKMAEMEPQSAATEEATPSAEVAHHEKSETTDGHGAVTEATTEHGATKTEHEADAAIADDQVAAMEEEMTTDEEMPSQTAKAAETPVKTPSGKANAEPVKVPKNTVKAEAKYGSGNFTIQVASYSTQEEADKKVTELKALKFESFTTAATIKGNLWYRVNVGMFATIKEAQEHKSLLSERAKVATAIIQKIKK